MMCCKACGSEDGRDLRVREMMFGSRAEFDYRQCGQCGSLQIARVPENLGDYYQHYYSFTQSRPGALRQLIKRARASQSLGRRSLLGYLSVKMFGEPYFAPWIRTAGVRPASRILDVGSGAGQLLRDLAQAGFQSLEGIDPYAEQEVRDAQFRVSRKHLSEVDDDSYDFVILNHSFEHMSEPCEALTDIRRVLRPDGTALVRTPVAGSHAFRHYGSDWVQLDAPRHLFIVSVAGMEALARRAELVLERVVFDSTHFQFTGSERYRRDVSLYEPHPDLFDKRQLADLARQAADLNRAGQGDQAGFYLKRSTGEAQGARAPQP